jgi:large subunit ribosomal protein L24
MKQTFSTKWVSSVQPRKQRKYRYNAPLHLAGKFLSVTLAKDLRAKHGIRSIRVRTGDEVVVMRGQFSGRSGKVERVDIGTTRVFVNGIDQAKRDGTKRLYPLQPSNLKATRLVDEKRRFPVKETESSKTKSAATKSAAKSAAKADAANNTPTNDTKKPAPARAAKA